MGIDNRVWLKYNRGTRSAGRGPESGPPKGSQWNDKDHHSVLTKQKSGVRGPRNHRPWKLFDVDPETKSLSTPEVQHLVA